MNSSLFSRRNFLQLGASFGMLAGLGKLQFAEASSQNGNYKALVCVFLFGGNDGHNLVVPMDPTQYAAYVAARGGIALPQNQLAPINDSVQGAFGLHYGLPEIQALFQQGKAAVVSNVGMLVRPTTYLNYQQGFQLPTLLRSHSDQVAQMQTGYPSTGGSSGWGGRTLDILQANNAATTFPVSIAMNSPALFCAGNAVSGSSLQPGNYLAQNAMSLYPASAGQARLAAQQQIIAPGTGNLLVDQANKVMSDALALNPLLQSAASNPSFATQFPSTSLGNQLKEVARMISLRSQLNVGRQVFFVSLGGFDTHSGQSYQQWSLLQQVSQAVSAFYNATVEMGVASNVTTFTMSDFGRTLQPSGTGSDHGWGSHHFVVGGAVNGGKIYGQFPLMTNYLNFNNTHEDYADNRGTLLPQFSLAQYGATLAKWMGALDNQLDGLFPTLPNFALRDIGFLA